VALRPIAFRRETALAQNWCVFLQSGEHRGWCQGGSQSFRKTIDITRQHVPVARSRCAEAAEYLASKCHNSLPETHVDTYPAEQVLFVAGECGSTVLMDLVTFRTGDSDLDRIPEWSAKTVPRPADVYIVGVSMTDVGNARFHRGKVSLIASCSTASVFAKQPYPSQPTSPHKAPCACHSVLSS